MSTDQQGRAGGPPGEPLPVRLANTVWADRAGLHDSLTTREALAAWLLATGLSAATPRVTTADLSRARHLRDAVRRLAALVTADPRPAAASATSDPGAAISAVNGMAAVPPARPLLVLREGAIARAAAPEVTPAPAALARVAAEAMDLLTETPTSLRACMAPGCVLYFVRDHPRRQWCSTSCGNRARAARHYLRHRRDSSGQTLPSAPESAAGEPL